MSPQVIPTSPRERGGDCLCDGLPGVRFVVVERWARVDLQTEHFAVIAEYEIDPS
jgi:hypothetical protein